VLTTSVLGVLLLLAGSVEAGGASSTSAVSASGRRRTGLVAIGDRLAFLGVQQGPGADGFVEGLVGDRAKVSSADRARILYLARVRQASDVDLLVEAPAGVGC